MKRSSRHTSPQSLPPDTDKNQKRRYGDVEPDNIKRTKRRREGDVQSQIKNLDYCDSCGGTGRFLCCDACPKAFHFTCMEPPMDYNDVDNLQEEWYCRECEYNRRTETRQQESSLPSPSVTGLFTKLMQNLEKRNPKAYQLPSDIQSFFEGVSADRMGNYVDMSVMKSIKHSRSGHPDIPDDHRLYDNQGKPIVCFRCRQSPVHKRIVGCDYCPLYWHMDCLDPPLVGPPNPTRKWMCPNHPEHVMPRMRRKHNAPIIDLPSGQTTASTADALDPSEEDASSALLVESISDDDTDTTLKYSNTLYRLPSSSITLDFFDSARKDRERSHTRSSVDPFPSPRASDASPPKKSLNSYASSQSLDEQEAREWLEGLSSLFSRISNTKENGIPTKTKKDLDITLSPPPSIHNHQPSTSPTKIPLLLDTSEIYGKSESSVQVSLNEYERLKKIEKLMLDKNLML
ncbi:hypothetical protein BCR43DRAFT_497547 [Syncephalastrum racemosum]|uniref:PHD-type domain-containing protein n=1 Tax=Syncephalastrum racemosum TaxID=13706 RepID=A0A1X2H2K2_SYNRA|nr:hypothetical protein BCR43DRAFT_497547 [Syncephalastrum racemosum]